MDKKLVHSGMVNKQVHRMKTISDFHQFRRLPKPEHPLISVIDYASMKHALKSKEVSLVLDFYSIGLKRNINGKMRYGQQEYDFDEGFMFFISPGQVFSIVADNNPVAKPSGTILLVHPDFLWNTSLARTINQYEYFGYDVNEALFLSKKEETVITGIMHNTEQEYHANIDKFSQDIITAQLELLLRYADRFYHRQFITRKITNHKILSRLEAVLTDLLNDNTLTEKGLPTVQRIAEILNVSPNYLSGLLKVLTGQSTQQHIHDKLIEKAKEKLSTSDLTVSEIAYGLGFEHPQSFIKLFKLKTNLSPGRFRQSLYC